jgi:asparagine synthase (glutamine-hydrolysing)
VASATGFKCNYIRPALLDYRKCVEQVGRYSDVPDYVNGAVFDGLREELVRRGSRVVLTGLGGDQWLQGSEYYLCDLIARCRWRELVHQLNCDQRFGMLVTPREKLRVLLRWGIKPMMPKVTIRILKRIMRRPLYLDAIRAPFAREIRLAERLDTESPYPLDLSYGQRSIYNNWVSPWMIHALEMDDRSNAWIGIEGRHPFYDRRVLEFALAIPEDQQARLDLTKFVLRTAMKGLLPECVRQRRTKGRLGRIFVQIFEKLGGEHLFEKTAMESNGWIDAGRMQQICAERLNSPRPFDLWPLWTTFAVDLWYREVFGNSTGAGSSRLNSSGRAGGLDVGDCASATTQ